MVSNRSPRRSSSRSSSKTFIARACTLVMPFRAALAAMRATASSEMSTAITSVHTGDKRQGEPAVVAERIERPAASVAGRGDAVLALVEKQTRLLAVVRIDHVAGPGLRESRCLPARCRGAPSPSARAPRADARAGRCGRESPPAAAARRAGASGPAAADRPPAPAPGAPGSRRSDRRRAPAGDRLRREPGDRPSHRCRATRDSVDGGIEPGTPHVERRHFPAASQHAQRRFPIGRCRARSPSGTSAAVPSPARSPRRPALTLATSLRYTQGWPFRMRSSPRFVIETVDMGSALSCQLSALSYSAWRLTCGDARHYIHGLSSRRRLS